MKTAIVQCSAADVNRLIDGVLGRMNREIGEHVVVKSGQADIHEVVSKFEGCSGKRKQLLVIEQAESLSSQFLNGLFYSLPSLRCDIIVLLCVSTKQIMFTSRVSRRCLALLHARRFLFSLSPEVFYNLVTNVLFNPSFTDLRLQAGFLRFIRSTLLTNDFSESKERDSELIALHEHVQAAGFLGIANSSKYRDWTQSVSRMSEVDIKRMMNHEGIHGYNIKLEVPDQSDAAVQREADSGKLLSPKPLTEKTSVLQLKNKMKEIIAARQLNPQLLARQRLIREIEIILRSVLRPFTTIPYSGLFLFGDESVRFLAPNVTCEVERSMLCQGEQHPLGIALRTLVEQGRWKTVSLMEWGKSFVEDMMTKGLAMDKKRLESIFFACE
ncbi:hypothetical protein ANCDUO_05822 [Ancylostoma duodenale]|uniref:Uncharacterized protein n=1 Tax=Ancylostoma duodenale TaxID=51022 RepID=A0A0C2H389_9BILA|nr:hypothetical protein ANCDUO_05822 [Ancylostoma duodenale]